jgi:APA family basic amino acid/polyamine antiporter
MRWWQQLGIRKTLDQLDKEAQGENRLRRVLGPIGLTSLGIGAIIGAGIFVITGRVAAVDAGPAIMLSFAFAGVGCALAAFCYAEFASMAPVAGSAYTYAYATLGELVAWIIGWDLILEYAMSAATVAAGWSEYFNKFTDIAFGWQVPAKLSNDPFSLPGAYLNLPAVVILALVTIVLVIGIRESAFSNTLLVMIKLGVVLFVIAVGIGYINKSNWTDILPEERIQVEETKIPDAAEYLAKDFEKLQGKQQTDRTNELTRLALADYKVRRVAHVRRDLQEQGKLTPAADARLTALAERYQADVPKAPAEQNAVAQVLAKAQELAPSEVTEKWGMVALFGLKDRLEKLDDRTRSNFSPFGISGVMLGAALVFFAFIGFDSISTHAEEAVRPQRDVPFGILASLCICTVLYILVSAVITGMQPYPNIDTKAAIAAAFDEKAKELAKMGRDSAALKASALLIALGGLAGMTSVLLITFLSQARIFLAMARDGLMPQSIFGAVHTKFRTPHISTMVTGAIMCVVAAFTPIQDLEKMVNIGTLFAFIVVCAAVLMLRIRRPDARRPFRCPALFVVAPLGILVNVTMMVFLPGITWLRLLGWLVIGLVIYFLYGLWHSTLGRHPELAITSPAVYEKKDLTAPI